MGLRENRSGLVAMLGSGRFGIRENDTLDQARREREARQGCIACCMPWRFAGDKMSS